MASYLTLDHVADLSAAQRLAARPLVFTVAPPNAAGDEFQAVFAGTDAAAAQNKVFRFEAVAGARYFFQSISFLDPDLLKVYDRDGKAVLANDEGDDPPQSTVNGLVINQDVIPRWSAPYSGTFYIDTSWFTFPGIFDQVGLVVLEDRDPGGPQRAPQLTMPLTDASWSEGTNQTWTLPFTTFSDPDSEPLAISVRQADGNALPAWLKFDPQTRKFSGMPPLHSADLNLAVTATDPSRLAVTDEVRLLTTEPTMGLTLNGSAGDDLLRATRFGDTINGGAGNDGITGGGGDDVIRGGTGIDTAIYAGPRAGFQIAAAGTGFTVTDSTGAEGRDTLGEVERLQFANSKVALDLAGNAGIVAKLLGAVFGPAAVANPVFVGIGLQYADQGMSYVDLGALAMSANARSAPKDVVALLWTNVVGTAPSPEQAQPFVDMLGNGTSIGQLVQLAAETGLNAMNINLVGLAASGIEYVGA